MVTIKNTARVLACGAVATFLIGCAYAIVQIHNLDTDSGILLGSTAGLCAAFVSIVVWEKTA